jgi:hypothetical protein
VRACAELPKLCEFFHIPFQSGDNDILREVLEGVKESCVSGVYVSGWGVGGMPFWAVYTHFLLAQLQQLIGYKYTTHLTLLLLLLLLLLCARFHAW